MRRLYWLLLFTIPLSLFAAKPVHLLGLDIRPGRELSKFIFVLDKATSGHVTYYNNQHQVFIDFDNTSYRFKMNHAWLADANVNSIDTIKMRGNKIRVILNVKGEIKYHHYYESSLNNDAHFVITIQSLPQRSAELKAAFNRDLLNVDKDALMSEPDNKKHVFTVVIDAGHGGKDSGAIGARGMLEKNVVLKIAKQLAQEINEEPNMRAILTRSGDYFVPLRERMRIARKNKADVFVAIHADAHYDSQAEGISVFALSKHGATSEAARWLAQRENYSELNNLELNSLQDHSLQLRSVLIDLAQTVTIEDSLRLGNAVLHVLDDVSTLHYKKVEQAPFVVLKSPDVPSILVETGFITNPREEKRLTGAAYQHQIAYALKEGIESYVKDVAAEQD